MARDRGSLEERYLKYLTPGDPDKCWEWQGTRRPEGYGVIGLGGRTMGVARAHVLAWQWMNGREVPDGFFVCHRCDNPPCCNPAHLFIGTARDNHNDMRAKGRECNPPPRRGELNINAVLTEGKVRWIRSAAEFGYSAPIIARALGVRYAVVHRVIRGETWAWVE